MSRKDAKARPDGAARGRGGAGSGPRVVDVAGRLIEAPWLASNEVRRLLALPYIRLMFHLRGLHWGKRWRVFGMPIIQRCRGSSIVLGDDLSLRSWPASNPLAPNHPVVLATRTRGAVIRVGNDCGFTGATLVAAERIEIGNHVLLGANVTITDTDFHPIDPAERRVAINNGRHKPVVLEDDVFVGMGSIILKGVTLGRASVVGAGSVVTGDVPPRVLVAGNPARIIRNLQAPDGV